ncbi:uncharacterized protein OCT59_021395 [Rhizophagus irregularis]|uniref:uncharacterized protein n=1 Tax=Rhizophagus irregularis TaxID=588596 RepID=UPI00331C7DEC|nr:hypothetical protein OCT59_021395 [Rhizophagus irregularis]
MSTSTSNAFRGSRYLSALRSRGYVPYSHVFMKYWEKLLLSGGFTAKYDMAILVTSDKVRGLTTVLSLVLPVYIGHTMFCDGVRSNRVIVTSYKTSKGNILTGMAELSRS